MNKISDIASHQARSKPQPSQQCLSELITNVRTLAQQVSVLEQDSDEHQQLLGNLYASLKDLNEEVEMLKHMVRHQQQEGGIAPLTIKTK